MRTILGEPAPSYTTVKKWVAEFKRGRESIEDDQVGLQRLPLKFRKNV
jgi:hypothetical protein